VDSWRTNDETPADVGLYRCTEQTVPTPLPPPCLGEMPCSFPCFLISSLGGAPLQTWVLVIPLCFGQRFWRCSLTFAVGWPELSINQYHSRSPWSILLLFPVGVLFFFFEGARESVFDSPQLTSLAHGLVDLHSEREKKAPPAGTKRTSLNIYSLAGGPETPA